MKEIVIQQTKRSPNCKCPGPDGIKGYWLKNFTALHERIKDQLNDMINNGVQIPKWKTTGKTAFLRQKILAKKMLLTTIDPSLA